METIIVTVLNGCVEVESLPKNVRVLILDMDADEWELSTPDNGGVITARLDQAEASAIAHEADAHPLTLDYICETNFEDL